MEPWLTPGQVLLEVTMEDAHNLLGPRIYVADERSHLLAMATAISIRI